MKSKTQKSSTFNRFQHRCAEYCAANRDIRPGMANVLSAIAHFLNAKSLRCFPSYDRIALYAGVNRSTVIRNVKKLIALGIVEKTQESLSGGGFRNVFQITFIKADFCVKTGWQKAHLSRIYNIHHKTISNNTSVSYYTNNTNNNRVGKSLVKPPERNGLKSGFRWMEKISRRSSDPEMEFFKKYGSSFGQGYYPAMNNGDSPEEYSVECEVPQAKKDKILENPIECAEKITGEMGNEIFRRTMLSRYERLGHKAFAGEVLYFYSMLLVEQSDSKKGYYDKHPEKRIKHRGKVLVSRMDKLFAEIIATKNHTQQADWQYLWDVAEGKEEMPIFRQVA